MRTRQRNSRSTIDSSLNEASLSTSMSSPSTPSPSFLSEESMDVSFSPSFEEGDPSGHAKRRLSEELVVPYTGTLGPRKRAKTSAEKEQRRVERIIRNRTAARDSRDRKRQHMAELEVINDKLALQNQELVARTSRLESDNDQMRQQLLELTNQIQSFQNLLVPPTANPVSNVEHSSTTSTTQPHLTFPPSPPLTTISPSAVVKAEAHPAVPALDVLADGQIPTHDSSLLSHYATANATTLFDDFGYGILDWDATLSKTADSFGAPLGCDTELVW